MVLCWTERWTWTGAIAALGLCGAVVVTATAARSATVRDLLVQTRACAGCNLRGDDLSGLDLRGASLPGANLSYAVATLSDLRGADLRGADLRYAYLWGADLTGARLDGALLCGTVMPNGSTSSVGCGAPVVPTATPMATPMAAPAATPMAAPTAAPAATPVAVPMGAPQPPVSPGPQLGAGQMERLAATRPVLELRPDPGSSLAAASDRLAPGEQDLWQINVPPGRLNAIVLSPDPEVRLDIVSPTGEPLVRNRRQGSVEVPAQGRYGILVENSRRLTTYDVAATLDPVLEPARATLLGTMAAAEVRALSLDPIAQTGQVTSTIASAARQVWLVDARRGTLEVKLQSDDPQVQFAVLGQDGRHFARQSRQQLLRIPADGQYRVVVMGGETAATYELQIRQLRP